MRLKTALGVAVLLVVGVNMFFVALLNSLYTNDGSVSGDGEAAAAANAPHGVLLAPDRLKGVGAVPVKEQILSDVASAQEGKGENGDADNEQPPQQQQQQQQQQQLDAVDGKEEGKSESESESESLCGDNTETYLFIGGHHFSGTTFLAKVLDSHPCVTGFHGTGVSQDEGQHLQKVFATSQPYGGALNYAINHPGALFLTEDSPLVTQENREKLLEQWGKHWSKSRPVKAEKSPPNLVKMRFLQAMMPDGAKKVFILSMKHPLTIYARNHKPSTPARAPEWVEKSGCEGSECRTLDFFLTNYRVEYDTALTDAAYIENIMCFKYESWALGAERAATALESFLDIHGGFTFVIDESKVPGRTLLYPDPIDMPNVQQGGGGGRRLAVLNAHATPDGALLFAPGKGAGEAVQFARTWQTTVSESDAAYLIDKHESGLNTYGYSLVDATRVSLGCGLPGDDMTWWVAE